MGPQWISMQPQPLLAILSGFWRFCKIVDGYIDGHMDGRTDRHTDGWTNGHTLP